MKKKQKAGHKAKKRLPADKTASEGSRAKTADRNEVRRVTTHRQGHPK
jgi:hypothetical protein